ncbi:MAG: LAGLIDADG family homing endonuclease [Chloroflexi bacterium]|nr:LAGLIDADG family homing endonuclease [Chloroflexota bacterium]
MTEFRLIDPSVDFAYLIGVIAGDGCITRAGHVYKLEISCDAAYPELIVIFQDLIARLTGLRTTSIKVKGKRCVRVVANSAGIPELLGLPPGAKSKNGFRVPEWIFENVEYVKAFVRGLIETDGTVAEVYRHGGWYAHIHFSAANPIIMDAFLRAVEILGYSFKRVGPKAYMANTALARKFAAELGIAKSKTYVYS